MKQTAEQQMPWIIYTYGRSHDGWWPPWNSTRITGRMKIGMDCSVCGNRTVATLKIPRFGPVNPDNRYHPARSAYLLAHLHPDRGHPISWARPLKNLDAFGPRGMDLDLFAALPRPLGVDVRRDQRGRSRVANRV